MFGKLRCELYLIPFDQLILGEGVHLSGIIDRTLQNLLLLFYTQHFETNIERHENNFWWSGENYSGRYIVHGT